KNYRLPEAHQQEIKVQVNQMLEDDIVTTSKSEWNFPLLVIPKKLDASGKRKFRICIDFRKLNEITIGDSYPLPNIQDILDKIGKARYFSALDCASGYLQVPIDPEDQCKIDFSTSNGETLEEHHVKLREVFEKLRECNIKIEPDKCEFLKVELNYLGHIVTANGVKPDPKKINAVSDFPTPKTQKDIKSFLGLAGYYRKFIDKFSAIARPLTDLLKKDHDWQWSEAEQASFDLLKYKLTHTPLLQYPNFAKPFILTTDASGYAIGAILSQGKLGQDKPIAYASRTLNSAEVNYSTVEKELLAIVWACKHFRPYVLGRKFQIVTDHRGLVWIFNVKDPSSRLIRWKLQLEEYDYEIQYRAGKRNCNADSLSRYPVECLITHSEEITEERKQKIINEMHCCPVGGHQGIQKTIERIKLYISWPGLEHDVTELIRECKICQVNKDTRPKVKQPLEITDTQTKPWDKIYLDIVGPLPQTEKGNKYLLTCQDNLSKYVIAIPLHTQTIEEIVTAFMNHIILIYGIPSSIVTDQGSNFMSDMFKRLCKLMRIEKINTTAYHPESNGALERTHKSLVTFLRCFCDPKTSDWDYWIFFACFTYNTSPHSVTKYTPYEMLFGRK
ncbi:Retrovirus-related Pol polyprotein from transposon 17.6, partial [Zootermopsis nevadensis]